MTCTKIITDSYLFLSTRFDFVEIEDLSEKTVLGRYCGSHSVPPSHTPKGSQIRIRFVSDEYFPSDPGFCIRYSLLPLVRKQSTAEMLTSLENLAIYHPSMWFYMNTRKMFGPSNDSEELQQGAKTRLLFSHFPRLVLLSFLHD